MSSQQPLRDLDDGLILRHATGEDTDALVDMQIHAFANPDTGELDEFLGGWTRDLMGGKHPGFTPADFLVVENTATRTLVSCMCLISQTWTIQDVPVGVGRVEIVGTLEPYRKRGLVRAQFQVLHEMSQARGELLQAITGIPYYYRQFGYEFAIEMPAFRQQFVPQQVPKLKEGETEKFHLRRPERSELSFVAEMYRQSARRTMIHCERDQSSFAFEQFDENDKMNGFSSWWDIIETTDGERVGILLHRRFVFEGRHGCHCFEILPQFGWDEVASFTIRELVRQAETYENVGNQPLSKLVWSLSPLHPLYELLGSSLTEMGIPYAWYIRVPDMPAFLNKLAPVLDSRLAASEFRGHSGSLCMNFFRDGVELLFENGKLCNAQPWRATAGDYGLKGFGNATFPDLTFLKLLFGYRSLRELTAMFPDVTADNDKTTALLNVLFPKTVTNILPIH